MLSELAARCTAPRPAPAGPGRILEPLAGGRRSEVCEADHGV